MQLLEDMAQGLTSLHARGIVHRDLKPQNVLITDSGRGKLSDMGMCKRLIPNQSTFITSGAGVARLACIRPTIFTCTSFM